MGKHKVTVFSPYPFEVGQKIHISSGPRHGDWEVAAVDERKVTLRCPVSLRQFAWNRFCYAVEECDAMEWPQED